MQINRAMHLSSSSSFFMRLGSSEARRSRLVRSQSSSSLCLAVAASASEQICTPNRHHCMVLTGSRLHMHAHCRWLGSMQRSAVKHVVSSSAQPISRSCHKQTVTTSAAFARSASRAPLMALSFSLVSAASRSLSLTASWSCLSSVPTSCVACYPSVPRSQHGMCKKTHRIADRP